MIAHCLNLEVFVMHNKMANCFGFCSLALSLSGELITDNQYKLINVQICHLFNWDHVLMKISYGSYSIFYDPGWQRCSSLEPHPDILIEEQYFYARMDRLVEASEKHYIQMISHFTMHEHHYSGGGHILLKKKFQ